MTTQVSAVILTWNSARHIERALTALLREAARIPTEVIVVDNGSSDRSVEIATAVAPEARVVRNTKNQGVARGRNQGARLARGTYVLFLDSDTEMAPGSLEAMVRFLESHPTAAVVGPKLVHPDGRVQYSSRKFPTLPGKLLRLLPLAWRRTVAWAVDEEMLHLDRSVARSVDYVIGACQLIRRSVLESVGDLDERMFYGPEDVDFCLRAWRAGWEVWYVPAAVVVHGEQRVTHLRLDWLTLRHGMALGYYFWKHGYLWRRPRFSPPAARLRVLELVTLSDWGGAQVYVYALSRGLKDAYDVTVACAPGGPLVARLRAEGIRVVELPTLVRTPSPLADLITLWRLARWMRHERFAIVHCHSTKAGLLGRFAARMAGVPGILFTVHGWPFTGWWHPLVRRGVALAERMAARVSTAIICVCDHDRQQALRMRIGGPERLVVIHNGVDPAPHLASAPSGGRAGADRSCTVVGVGRLTIQKDPVTLLRAWRQVPGPHRLVLVGDGPLRPELEAMIHQDGMAARTVILGARDDVPVVLGDADLFASASLWEGLPFAVIEAMMSGLPVVATEVGGVSEMVVAGETGLLAPPGNPDALASALTRLLGDAAMRRRMGAAGRRRALAHFTEARMLKETADLYARALGTQTRAGVGRSHFG